MDYAEAPQGWQDMFSFTPMGMQQTQSYEGFRSKPYIDTKGKKTIGYGFNMTVDKNLPNQMTKQQAQPIFEQKYMNAIYEAQKYAGANWNALNPQRQAILVDMAYNMGGGKLGEFKEMRKAIKTGNMQNVPVEMKDSDWYSQVGNRSKEHIKNWGK